MKTVSVILPNYNDSEHLPISLPSLCEQSCPPKEVVVVDDASTDNSLEIIEQLMVRYPCIRLVCNQTNLGALESCNKVRRLLTGDYVYFASANDLVLPGLFEKSLQLLEEHPEAGLSCADQRVEHLHNGRIYDVNLGWSASPVFLTPDQAAQAIRRTKNVPLTSILYRRDLLDSDQLYNVKLEWHADFWLTSVLMMRNGICYVPEQLALFRYSPGSYSAKGRRNYPRYREVFSEFIKLLASPQFEDIAGLMMKSDWFFSCPLPVRDPVTALRAVTSLKRPNSYAKALVGWVTKDFFRDICLFSFERFYQFVLLPILQAFGRAKNLGDQIYARAFHEYDRLRTAIRQTFQQ